VLYGALVTLPALGLLVLTGCSGDGDNSSSSSPSTSTASTPSQTPSVTQSTPISAASTTPKADVTITVTVAGGKVNPSGATIRAKAGQTVLITATTDVDDELHVHGYDKEVELEPGKPASVEFVANMKGTFEIETHKSGKLIAKLVVS
jgi:FtsP/CotA-like multicopper oxidase with cupredoxin domain